MKLLSSIAVILFAVFVAGQAKAVTADDVMKMNLGVILGSVPSDPESTCELEVADGGDVIPGATFVTWSMNINAELMIYPDDDWKFDETRNSLIRYEDFKRTDFVELKYNPTTLKFVSFQSFLVENSIPKKRHAGPICILQND